MSRLQAPFRIKFVFNDTVRSKHLSWHAFLSYLNCWQILPYDNIVSRRTRALSGINAFINAEISELLLSGLPGARDRITDADENITIDLSQWGEDRAKSKLKDIVRLHARFNDNAHIKPLDIRLASITNYKFLDISESVARDPIFKESDDDFIPEDARTLIFTAESFDKN